MPEQLPLFDAELPAIESRHVLDRSEPDAEDVCECGSCGRDIPSGEENIAVGHDVLCGDCARSCDDCGNTFTAESGEVQPAFRFGWRGGNPEQSEDTDLCSECSRECDDCHHRFAYEADGGENCGGEWVCGRCVAEYSRCDSCECMLSRADTYSNRHDEGTYCRECHEDGENDTDEHEHVHGYSYKPAPRFQTVPNRVNSSVFLGVEIEVEGGLEAGFDSAIEDSGLGDDDAFYCKEDGSLSHGFEIVSHPGSWQFWQSHTLGFAAHLKRAGYKSYDTTTCGMHIHVSRSALSSLDVFKLLAFAKDNTAFIRFVSRRTAANLNRWASVDELSSRETLARKAKGKCRVEYDRYEAINVTPVRTIEFRIFRGTLDVPAIRRNIAFVYALVRFVQCTSIDRLTHIHLRDWIETAGRVELGAKQAKSLLDWFAEFTAD